MEKLQSSEEELTASNEELQATSEELKTTNDELHLQMDYEVAAKRELEEIAEIVGVNARIVKGATCSGALACPPPLVTVIVQSE